MEIKRRKRHEGSVVKSVVCLVAGLLLGGSLSFLCFVLTGGASELFHEQVSVMHAVQRQSDTILQKQQVPLIRGAQLSNNVEPISVQQVIDFLSNYLHMLHEELAKIGHTGSHELIWEIYHNLTMRTLYPWDVEYLQKMPKRRNDNSIFLSLASYRDENCLPTIRGAYQNAKHPEKLFVGLVQQNCEDNCQSGVLEGGKVKATEPDQDCHAVFCALPEGKPHCDAGRVRALHIQEAESLGPYAARYFASKLWGGEEWYMQIDSHMSFAQNWDVDTVQMLQKAPSKKPVISHYPPSKTTNFESAKLKPAPRICGPVFADSPIEGKIVRLEGAGVYDSVRIDTPRFAPFVAAGYFAAHSEFLREVPFDPFLPWIFMGEEIIMSARLWTSGYDIFSPIHSVVGHIYVRRHKPKFWETVGRLFSPGIHNPLQLLVLERVKTQLLYPESARDLLKTKSLFTAIEEYTMGKTRSVEDYLEMVGLDPRTKTVTDTKWCEEGMPPRQFQHLAHLYKQDEGNNKDEEHSTEEEGDDYSNSVDDNVAEH